MPRLQIKPENIPVPEIYVIAIILSIVLKIFFPAHIFKFFWIGHVLGWPLSVIGVFISLWAVSEAGQMSIDSPNRLISTGPYAYSRNLMYVGWALIYLGIILILNSLWSLGLLVIVLVYTHFIEIRPEEKFLQKKFGAQYDNYRKNVNRYV